MSFWENIGETISVKGKEVAGKAKNLTDIASLKGQISTCESTINKNYRDIGRAYYEAHETDENTEFADQVNAIKNAKVAIEELEKKIQDLKGTKHCCKCGADVPNDSVFCPKCGSKLEDEFFDEDGDNAGFEEIIDDADDLISDEQ